MNRQQFLEERDAFREYLIHNYHLNGKLYTGSDVGFTQGALHSGVVKMLEEALRKIESGDVGECAYDSPFDGEEVLQSYATKALSALEKLRKEIG